MKNPLDSIVSGFNSLLDFFGGLITGLVDAIGSLLSALFVPSGKFFDDKFSKLSGILSIKLNVQDYEELLNSLNTAVNVRSGLPNLTVTIFGSTVTIVDLSWYSKYQSTFYSFVRGTMFVLLIIYNFNMLYKLVRKDELSHSSKNVIGKGG